MNNTIAAIMAIAEAILPRGKHHHYNVKPRYTCGSPAAVSRDIALNQVREEAISYDIDLSGVHGEEQLERAKTLGLGPSPRQINWAGQVCDILRENASSLLISFTNATGTCEMVIDKSANLHKAPERFSPVELVEEHSNHWMVTCMLTGEIFTRPFAWIDPRKYANCKKCQQAKEAAAYRAMEGSYS